MVNSRNSVKLMYIDKISFPPPVVSKVGCKHILRLKLVLGFVLF